MALEKDELCRTLHAFLATEADPLVREGLHNGLECHGRCNSVAEDVHTFLMKTQEEGQLSLVQCIGFRKSLKDAPVWFLHEGEKTKFTIWHCVTRLDDWYIDLTGSQFSPEMAGVRIWTLKEMRRFWKEIFVWNPESYSIDLAARIASTRQKMEAACVA